MRLPLERQQRLDPGIAAGDHVGLAEEAKKPLSVISDCTSPSTAGNATVAPVSLHSVTRPPRDQ